jgi:hypothetical protein
VSIPQPLWKNPTIQHAAIALAGFAFLYKLPALIRNYDHHLIYFFGVMVPPPSLGDLLSPHTDNIATSSVATCTL